MDEILASIRRIIESGDEGKAPAGKAVAPPIEAGDDDSAAQRGAGASSTPRFDIHYLPTTGDRSFGPNADDRAEEDDRAELGRARDQDVGDEEVVVADPSEPADQMALRTEIFSAEEDAHAELEALNSVDWEAERFEAPVGAPPAENENEVHSAAEVASEVDRDFAFEFDDAAFEAALRHDAWHEPVANDRPADDDVEAVEEERPSAILPEAAVSEPMVERIAPQPMSMRPEMPESVIAGASALLSAQAGDQVAAAFDDLTRAIRGGHMHSMEEMSRELLRPMLQEWLEDNLPRIVERLVRDEIERIARGPRR